MTDKLTEHTLIPLVWVKTLVGAAIGLIMFAIGGVWWAATVQSDVSHLREEVAQMRVSQDQRFNRIEQKLDARSVTIR